MLDGAIITLVGERHQQPNKERINTMDNNISTLRDMFASNYPVVVTESWKTLPIEEQQALRQFIYTGKTVFETLRQKFDQTVWDGHEDGSVSLDIESVRAKGDYKNGKPGRKALTPDEVLERALTRK